MSNDYYEAPDIPADFTRARAAPLRQQLAAVEAGFAKLPSRRSFFDGTANFAEAGGTANVLTATLDNAVDSYEDGLTIKLKIAISNTGAATLNINGMGAHAINSNAGVALAGGELVAGSIVTLTYVGGVFRLPATGPQGPKGDAGPAGGPPGADGTDGIDGADGVDGKTILSGAGAPGGGTGVDGDFYIQVITGVPTTIYGPKAGGVWPAGTDLQGPPGADGADGTVDTSDLALTGVNTVNSDEIGFRDLPISRTLSTGPTLAAADRGKAIVYTGGVNVGLIPDNSSVAIPVGAIITLVNNGSGSLTMAKGTTTAKLAGSGTSANRVIAAGGVAWFWKIATNTWFVGGAGVT